MKSLTSILQKTDFPFEIIQHESPIRSAQEGVEYFGIELGQTAPTLVLKSDRDYFSVIFSGDRGRLDLAEIAQIVERDQVKLASPKEVQQLTGFTVGSVPMVGLSMPCIVDRRLYRYTSIYGGTGEPTSTLKLNPRVLEELNQVIAWLE